MKIKKERMVFHMEVRTAASPKDVKHYTTQRLREEFLIPQLFIADEIKLVYSHIDRIITGGAMPVEGALKLTAGEELRAEYFLQRRELGVINIGGPGIITVDGRKYEVGFKEGMYIGMGARDIVFDSVNADLTGVGSALNDNLYIDDVLHKTFIEVDERGTKAGAATVVIAVAASAMMPYEEKTVYLDRPFVYIIADCESWLPAFYGVVQGIE